MTTRREANALTTHPVDNAIVRIGMLIDCLEFLARENEDTLRASSRPSPEFTVLLQRRHTLAARRARLFDLRHDLFESRRYGL